MSEIEHSNSLCSVEVTRVVSVSSSEWFSVVFDTLLAAFLYVAVGGAPGGADESCQDTNNLFHHGCSWMSL